MVQWCYSISHFLIIILLFNYIQLLHYGYDTLKLFKANGTGNKSSFSRNKTSFQEHLNDIPLRFYGSFW